MNFHWTEGTTRTIVGNSEIVDTDFYNLKNKAEGPRRYGYRNQIIRFENRDGQVAYRFDLQATLNGARYQSGKDGPFVATEAEARAGLAKAMAGSLKRYAKLATDPSSRIERRA